jgi:ATP-dependent DNA ligase
VLICNSRKVWQRLFVLDSEAVVLSVDGVSDFNALHSRKHDDEVQFCAFDILVEGDGDLPGCRCTCARRALSACLHGALRVSSSIRLNAARSGLTCCGRRAAWALRDWSPSIGTGPIRAADRSIG